MKMTMPSEFQDLMGGIVVTGSEIARELASLLTFLSNGDAGNFSWTCQLEVARIKFAVVVATYGAESKEAKSELSSLGFLFYYASRDEGANYWSQVVYCYENCGSELADYKLEMLQEARRHLAGS